MTYDSVMANAHIFSVKEKDEGKRIPFIYFGLYDDLKSFNRALIAAASPYELDLRTIKDHDYFALPGLAEDKPCIELLANVLEDLISNAAETNSKKRKKK